MKRFAVLFALILLLFSSCSTETYGDAGASNSLPDNVALPEGMLPYAELPKEYSLEQAKQDGCVILENSDNTYGQESWDAFVEQSGRGEPAFVRLAVYYTLGDPSHYSPEYYEEIKDEYPALYIQDLSYDGKQYRLYSFEGDQEYIREYKYLVRYFDISKNGSIDVGTLRYVLANEDTYTWKELERSMFSSETGPIDFVPIYTKHRHTEEHVD